ncbi:hypothetical protein [Mesorhizobium sp. LNJC394B00]|uniref:hypothetical protein n=1 Tax=Mesorhizobium sp. LNJC394B00 TaxID=1287274 RepID=UPI0012EC18DD|nr:hypothetical protein [Mesorhizobium sp. LNJC394B00]
MGYLLFVAALMASIMLHTQVGRASSLTFSVADCHSSSFCKVPAIDLLQAQDRLGFNDVFVVTPNLGILLKESWQFVGRRMGQVAAATPCATPHFIPAR